jgi:microcystin-dependent protein
MIDTTIEWDDFIDGLTEESSPANSDFIPTKKTGVTGKKTQSSNLAQVATNTAAIAAGLTPSGAILDYAGSTAPTGWLKCEGATMGNGSSGATFAGSQYETLFDIVKTGWGNAGTEVFADDDTVLLPDLRGMFTRGTGSHGSLTMADSNPFAGPAVGSSENDLLQSHYHQEQIYTGAPSTGIGIQGLNGTANTTNPINTNLPHVIQATTDGVNGTPRTGDETRPVAYGVTKIIKY